MLCPKCNTEYSDISPKCPNCGFTPEISPAEKYGILWWFILPITQFADFKGRTNRKEYWMYVLIYILISLPIEIVSTMLDIPMLSLGLSLILLVPSIAIFVRRMHDIGRTGWWVIVPIVSIVFACFKGTSGENKYGQEPEIR